MKIGIFGGTFDPPHIGHLRLAQEALEILKLDKVLFIPCYLPPHKTRPEADAEHRFKMLIVATEDNPTFEVSEIEMKRKRISYTVETLEEIYQTIGGELFLLIGSDSDISSWRDPKKILSLAKIVVFPRIGFEIGEEFPHIRLNTTIINISSTDIRKLLKTGRSIKYLVPQAVEEYIHKNRLYITFARKLRIRE